MRTHHIHEAARNAWADRVSELAAKPGRVNQTDLSGETPLEIVASVSEGAWVMWTDTYLAIASILLRHGVYDYVVQDALQIARNYGKQELVELLIEYVELRSREPEW